VLVDALFARTITLDADLELVALALDGRRAIDELLGDLRDVGLDAAVAEKNLRALLLLNVVEGTDARAVPKLRALRDKTATLDAAALPETRHACQGSGGCCRNYRVGPLTDADVARIDALGAAHGLPGLDDLDWYVTASLDGHAVRFMRTRDDGRCVFLGADQRCGLHARFGPASKPRACSRYPIDLVTRYDGVHIFDRGGCDSYGVAIRHGLPVLRDAPRLAPFTEESPRLTHPLLVLPGGALVDWAFVHPVVDLTLRELGRRQGNASEALRALVRRLTVLGDELARPPSLDLAERAVNAVCDPSRADAWAPTAPQSITVGARAAAALLSELAVTAEGLRDDVKAPVFARRQAEGAVPILRVASEAAARLAAPGARVSPETARALAASVDAPELDAATRYELRQELFGHGATASARAQTSLLRLACQQLVALYGARLGAASRGTSAATAEDFGPPHALANRLLGLDRFADVMARHAPQCRAVLEALPTLARWR
jgi:Fe-S-cluster containining protein